jgi:hypothetical protein
MCGYLFFINNCGCFAGLKVEMDCSIIIEQLNRINLAEAWTPDALSVLPFTLPESCKPGWHNTRIVVTSDMCSPRWAFSCPSIDAEATLPENPDSIGWLFE